MMPGYANMPTPKTPIDLLYSQIELAMHERASGQGATEAIQGLLSMIDPIKDDTFKSDIATINAIEPKEIQVIFWKTITAIFRLLDRKKLWTFRLVVRAGEEFIQGT